MSYKFEQGRVVAKKVVDNNNAGIVTGLMPVEYDDVYYFIDRATEGERRKPEPEHGWDGNERRMRTRRDDVTDGRRVCANRRTSNTTSRRRMRVVGNRQDRRKGKVKT